MKVDPAAARRASLVAGGIGLGAATLSGAAHLVVATYFARRVVTPEHHRPDDTVVNAVGEGTITLRANIDAIIPGCYGLWFGGTRAHARIGEILEQDTAAMTVTRELLGVDFGEIEPGPARWNGYYYVGRPDDALGLATEDIEITSDIGQMPAWVVHPEDPTSTRWAVLVHGRSAQRHETMRAIPVLRDLGYHVLVPTYRNDPGAPASPDGRYNLGLSEWHDVDAALGYAAGHRPSELLLAGWSMGGAIVLQALSRSQHSDKVTKVLLDAPVIDWGDVLAHQAAINRIPRAVERLSRTILGRRSTHLLAGIAQPLDLAETNWVARADELRHPMLLIHSDDDDFVPNGPSKKLAAARPDLVTMPRWGLARHVREWNVDPGRWEQQVREFAG